MVIRRTEDFGAYAVEMAKLALKLGIRKEVKELWYVIQTMTGQEEQVVELIEKMVPKACYQECFYIRRECARKELDNSYKTWMTPLFPGYVFVITNNPDKLYYELKIIPKLTKILKGHDEFFYKVSEEEVWFLTNIQDEVMLHEVKRSLVEINEDGLIIGAEGAVGKYLKKIIKQRLRKRCVWIEQDFLGEKRKILLNIKVTGDREV